jgi:hypothetical protein
MRPFEVMEIPDLLSCYIRCRDTKRKSHLKVSQERLAELKQELIRRKDKVKNLVDEVLS